MVPLHERASLAFRKIQDDICAGIEGCETEVEFKTDEWERPDVSGGHGGGGRSRILSGGDVFEQAGVNFSEVSGSLPAEMSEKLIGVKEVVPFVATGTSLVLHPNSPFVPTVHMNVRCLRVADYEWCGGGSDLTPTYLFEEDCTHFHSVLKGCCDRFDSRFYPAFKKHCDEYFYIPHRRETRGIGGIFFDYLGKNEPEKRESFLDFTIATGEAFLKSYLPIVERRIELGFDEQQREFQLYRRGRYVEFNLVYDRGTLFGLKTNGRAESILMSLPPYARWEYDYQVEPGSPEELMLEVLRGKPREWL